MPRFGEAAGPAQQATPRPAQASNGAAGPANEGAADPANEGAAGPANEGAADPANEGAAPATPGPLPPQPHTFGWCWDGIACEAGNP